MRKWFRDYGLSITLFFLFLGSWVGQFIAQIPQVTQQAEEHGQQFEWATFWPEFWSATLENWQSEFLQLFSFVVLTSFLIHRGSSESKDSDDRMEAKLDQILERVEQGG